MLKVCNYSKESNIHYKYTHDLKLHLCVNSLRQQASTPFEVQTIRVVPTHFIVNFNYGANGLVSTIRLVIISLIFSYVEPCC